jgi:excisionase family DNA binding protein
MEPVKDMTTSEVAKEMRVSQAAVLSWIKSGRLKAYNVAVTSLARPIYRITRDSLIDFKEGNTVQSSSQKSGNRRRKPKTVPSNITKFF